ncbi:glycosyl transferase 4 family protein [Synechococcus sp. A18-40]|nr:glycosyl transferase 4 family protein [Synechococcus sp. A18-40]
MLFLIPLFRLHLLDSPNFRSSHSQPTPRGGGVVFVFVSCVASAFSLFLGDLSLGSYLPLLALPLGLVGFMDDLFNLPASLRYLAQLLTAIFGLLVSPLSQKLLPPFVDFSLLTIFIAFLLIVYITSVINFVNFMDGMDGLVAGCLVLSITVCVIKLGSPFPTWSLVGALVGFLIWNWSPSKIFMGDVGSTFLGAFFSIIVLQASSWSDALSLLLVSTPLLCDAFFCVVRRYYAKQNVFQAHRLHLFQRLHQAGFSHERVASIYIFGTTVLAISLLFGGICWLIVFAIIELFIGIYLDKKVAIPFSVSTSR